MLRGKKVDSKMPAERKVDNPSSGLAMQCTMQAGVALGPTLREPKWDACLTKPNYGVPLCALVCWRQRWESIRLLSIQKQGWEA